MLTTYIREQRPVAFMKWGDGEYQCANFMRGRNCDADTYTRQLGENLIKSFAYMSHQPNVYLGLWHTDNVRHFWDSIAEASGKSAPPPQWVDYHTIIIDEKEIAAGGHVLDKKMDLYRAIKNSPLKKIIICNELLVKSALIFGEDSEFVFVPFRDWFSAGAEKYINLISGALVGAAGAPATHILIFAAGMGSKVLIAELHKRFPNNIYLDFGSALDFICTKRDSRGRGYTYETLRAVFDNAGLLPEAAAWDAPEYDYIYTAAEKQLGIHLRGG